MPLIIWKDEYSVSHSKIDSQHKKLIDLINDLHEGMKNRRGKDVLEKILDDLIEYTVVHFRDEEQIMSAANYPDITSHKVRHSELIDQVEKYKEKYENGAIMLSLETMNFLKEWLTNHILGIDKQYVPYVSK